MGRPRQAKRNAAICKLLDTKRLSYAVIAEMVGTTRNAVSGVAFRRNHPYKIRVVSPGWPASMKTKIGTGYRPASYYPEKTALNTR